MIFSFNGYVPVVHPSSFVHPQATITGNVIIGRNVYIGPHAALRGDWGEIIIEDGCNVQESCTLHMFPGKSVLLEQSAHIGHGAIIHGATVGRNTLVGMNAVLMDEVVIGEECIIGALSFVKQGERFSARSLIVGNPAQRIKSVSDEMINWKTKGTELYQQLPKDCHDSLQETQALTEVPKDRPKQQEIYRYFGK